MGIVAAICSVACLVAIILVYFSARSNCADLPNTWERQWPHRVIGFIILLYSVFLINAYIVEIPSPFAPAAVEIPAHSRPAQVQELELKTPKPDTTPSAKEEHAKMLQEWKDSK